MRLPEEAQLLRIFIGEGDKHQGRPLYQELVSKAQELGMAGATVLRGVMGLGAHSRVHANHILRLDQDLPLVVEIVDSEERVRQYLEAVDAMIGEGLVTLERAQVIFYRHANHAKD